MGNRVMGHGQSQRAGEPVLKHLISVDYEPIFSTTGRLVESAHANNTTLTPVSHQ